MKSSSFWQASQVFFLADVPNFVQGLSRGLVYLFVHLVLNIIFLHKIQLFFLYFFILHLIFFIFLSFYLFRAFFLWRSQFNKSIDISPNQSLLFWNHRWIEVVWLGRYRSACVGNLLFLFVNVGKIFRWINEVKLFWARLMVDLLEVEMLEDGMVGTS